MPRDYVLASCFSQAGASVRVIQQQARLPRQVALVIRRDQLSP
jgi:hypothetical protein